MFKAQLVRDLAHGEVAAGYSFLGLFDQLFVDIMLSILARKHPQQAA